jgi:hypothetical protein
MEVVYIKIRNKRPNPKDLSVQLAVDEVSWHTVRDKYFEPQFQSGMEPIWLMDSGNAEMMQCTKIRTTGDMQQISVLLTSMGKWIKIPTIPNRNIVKRIMQDQYAPIKTYITRFYRGNISPFWYLAFTIRKPITPGEKSWHKFLKQTVYLSPKSADDPTFLSDDDIDVLARDYICGRKGYKPTMWTNKVSP